MWPAQINCETMNFRASLLLDQKLQETGSDLCWLVVLPTVSNTRLEPNINNQ